MPSKWPGGGRSSKDVDLAGIDIRDDSLNSFPKAIDFSGRETELNGVTFLLGAVSWIQVLPRGFDRHENPAIVQLELGDDTEEIEIFAAQCSQSID